MRQFATAWVLLSVFCLAVTLQAQTKPKFKNLDIPRVSHEPKLSDFAGMKPSPEWEGKLAHVSGFIQRVPTDGAPSTQHTDAYLGYDDDNLYAIFVAFDTEPQKIRARVSRREDTEQDDGVEIMLDTFYDHRRAYAFLCNPYGIQADAIWTEGQDFDFSFDTLWYSEGKRTPQGYIVKMAIPFRSLRFAGNRPQTWGILLNRGIPRNNEDTFWPAYSSRIQGRLNQEGAATGLEGISPGRNMQFIPYGIYRSFRSVDLRDAANPTFSNANFAGRMGLDAKFVLKDKFVVDVTGNPDFSQVESDEPQVTVNQRFELFFPEKRPFFLENASYFQTPIDLVFTRRIGDPTAGLRVTGKSGPYALGVLVSDDRAPGQIVPENDPLSGKRAYFAIGRINRDIGSQSTLGLIYTDREFEGSFNRVGGADARIKLGENWVASGQAVTSSTQFLDGTHLGGPAYEADLTRSGRQLFLNAHYRDRSPGFITQTGFDPQPDIRNLNTFAEYKFRPEGKHLISWGPNMNYYYITDHSGRTLNWGFIPEFEFEFARQTRLQFTYAEEMEAFRPQDFAGLTRNISFVRNTKAIEFHSDYFKKVGIDLDYRWGTRINLVPPAGEEPNLAKRTSAEVGVTVRPFDRLKIDNSYILFRLRDTESLHNIFNNHIVRSKWNYQITREWSVRLIGQYNTVLANPDFSVLRKDKSFNADFLLTYLLHPGTALYFGFNTNLQNPDLTFIEPGPAPNRFVNDNRIIFVKASYLFRF